MSRKKLRRFEEMKSFSNTFEYPVEMKGKWHSQVFMNDAPIVLELGCGRGEYTVGLSEGIVFLGGTENQNGYSIPTPNTGV